MKNFKKLKVWQRGWEIAIEVYKLSESLERQQSYTFSSQITCAALSIPSSITEGSGKRSEEEYFPYLEITLGSSFELEIQLDIMQELKIGESASMKVLIDRINEEQPLLYGMMNSLLKYSYS